MDGTSMMLNLSHGDHTTVQHLNLQLLRVGPLLHAIVTHLRYACMHAWFVTAYNARCKCLLTQYVDSNFLAFFSQAFNLPIKPYADYFTIWICSKSLGMYNCCKCIYLHTETTPTIMIKSKYCLSSIHKS